MDRRIHLALDRIHHAYGDPLSVDALARDAHLSRSRFAHLFRHAMGCGPGQYLRRVRLERARTLLLATPLTVKEIMAAVGFSDPSHFTRDFRSYHGMSPTELRHAHAAPTLVRDDFR